jgi:hypothetical protein
MTVIQTKEEPGKQSEKHWNICPSITADLSNHTAMMWRKDSITAAA